MSAKPFETLDAEQKLLNDLRSQNIQQRDKAWRYLYHSYFKMIRDHVAGNNGTVQDASDVFQDAITILHGNLETGKFKEELPMKNYFFGIARNLWLKELRRRQKTIISFVEITNDYPEETGHLINVEIVTLMLSELNEDCRNILVEFYFNQRTMAELKQMFNVSTIQSAKNKKYRCLNYLTQLFRERGISLE